MNPSRNILASFGINGSLRRREVQSQVQPQVHTEYYLFNSGRMQHCALRFPLVTFFFPFLFSGRRKKERNEEKNCIGTEIPMM